MGRRRRHKNISMRILFSPLHRKMYISRRPPLSFMPLFFLLALTLRGFAARCTDLSWQMHALKPGRDVIMIRTIVVKKRMRASAQRVQLKMMAVLISEAHSATNKLHAAACIRIWMQMRERDLLVVCAICMRRFDDSSP
jgi:hypothetical protein